MARQNLGGRIDRLLSEASGMARQQARRVVNRDCTGMDGKALLDALEASLPATDEMAALVGELDQQCEQIAGCPPRVLGNGDEVRDVHGFVRWLFGLQDGWARLPREMPPLVMRAWVLGTRYHPCNREPRMNPGSPLATPIPCIRCCDCWMVLPNARGEGWDFPGFPVCPVCGSERKTPQDFGYPDGTFFTWEEWCRRRGGSKGKAAGGE